MKKMYLLMLGILLSVSSLSKVCAMTFFFKTGKVPGLEFTSLAVEDVNLEDTMAELYEKVINKLNKETEADIDSDKVKLIFAGKMLPRSEDITVMDYQLQREGDIHILYR